MTQNFLKSLKGLTLEDAGDLCENHGYKVEVNQIGVPYAAVAEPNTVRLFYKGDGLTVVYVEAGDPLEVTDV